MAGISLMDMLSGPQGAPAKQQLGQQFGLDENMTQMALKALLPALSAGLQRNAQQPGGLQALMGALQSGGHDRYLDNPQSLSQRGAVDDGNGILGHLLGSKDMSRSVASHASQRTGIGGDLLKKMLPVVAAMAMGSLSKQSKQPNVAQALMGMLGGAQPQPAPKPSGLGGLLGSMLGGNKQQQQAPQGGLGALGGLLDADGDGSAVDDIFAMVMKGRS